MIVTLTEILTELRAFTDTHIQLQEFGFGPISNISTKDTNYPMMWIEPQPSYNNGNQFVLSLDMYILDLQKQDYSNLETIMNSTLLIGNDVISQYWEQGDIEDRWVIVENSVNITPFEYKFDDVLAGWIFTIEIEMANSLTNCNLPLDE